MVLQVEEELTKKNEGESKRMVSESAFDMEGGGAMGGGTIGRRSAALSKTLSEVSNERHVAIVEACSVGVHAEPLCLACEQAGVCASTLALV